MFCLIKYVLGRFASRFVLALAIGYLIWPRYIRGKQRYKVQVYLVVGHYPKKGATARLDDEIVRSWLLVPCQILEQDIVERGGGRKKMR